MNKKELPNTSLGALRLSSRQSQCIQPQNNINAPKPPHKRGFKTQLQKMWAPLGQFRVGEIKKYLKNTLRLDGE